MSTKIDCCSSYVECSDVMHCIKDDDFYLGCGYRDKLSQGICYYGKNANNIHTVPANVTTNETCIVETVPKAVQTVSKGYIYIYAYNRAFRITKRNKQGLSFKIENELIEKLKNLFDDVDVPYVLSVGGCDGVVDQYNEKNPEPINSRIVITIDDDTFHVHNFNGYLMKNFHADKIALALNSKGINGLKAKVETVGKHTNYEPDKYMNKYDNTIITFAATNSNTILNDNRVKNDLSRTVVAEKQLSLEDFM